MDLTSPMSFRSITESRYVNGCEDVAICFSRAIMSITILHFPNVDTPMLASKFPMYSSSAMQSLNLLKYSYACAARTSELRDYG